MVYKYAGMVTWEDIRVTFYDMVISGSSGSELKVSTILQNWRKKVWSSKTGLASPTDYKKDSTIYVYNLDWTTKSTWILHGSWPSVVKEGDLTYTSTDVKVIEVTISYDWAELDESTQ
ncbi:MAG: phage tail protein [Candidatus Cloacimonetes bacterium]|nr:phage tail protein [Candidatus Cloacimonadota bacterium]